VVATFIFNQFSAMGFEPQTAGQPIVNVRKRTTKVNLIMVVGIIVFLVVGMFYAVKIAGKSERGATAPVSAK
jgi:accessory gene regulator protein AgrB